MKKVVVFPILNKFSLPSKKFEKLFHKILCEVQKTILQRGLSESNVGLYLRIENKLNAYNALQTFKGEENGKRKTRSRAGRNAERSPTRPPLQSAKIRKSG